MRAFARSHGYRPSNQIKYIQMDKKIDMVCLCGMRATPHATALQHHRRMVIRMLLAGNGIKWGENTIWYNQQILTQMNLSCCCCCFLLAGLRANTIGREQRESVFLADVECWVDHPHLDAGIKKMERGKKQCQFQLVCRTLILILADSRQRMLKAKHTQAERRRAANARK